MKWIYLLVLVSFSCKQKAKVLIPDVEEEQSVEEEGSDDEYIPDDEDESADSTENTEETDEESSKTPAVVDDRTIALALENTSVELPCTDFVASRYDCNTKPDINRSLIVGGDPKTTYEIELRVRGIVEPMVYSGGVSDGKHLYTGGTAADPVYNIFRLSAESPKQAYYFNAATAVGAQLFALDYKMKIKVAGGSTVKLFASAQNGSIISNTGSLKVPEISKSSDVIQGQYIQLNVVSVVDLKTAP